MKKVILFVTGMFTAILAFSQMALNEVYVRPGNGQSEFIEIYNNAKTNINVNLDCFTILTYWRSGANDRGWYVLDLPPTAITPGGYYVAAASSPFNTQNNSNVNADLNWNNLPAGASLTKWQWNGSTGYTQLAISGAVDDLMERINGLDAKKTILIYKEGNFVQGLLAGSGVNTLDAEISSLPALSVNNLQGGCNSAVFSFSSVSGSPFLYFTNPASGNDNGYSRLYDGNCSGWDKSASGNEHTPGVTNNGSGGSSPADGTITTAQFMSCKTATSADVRYNITGITGAATIDNSFPVTVQIFSDRGTIGQYDPGVDVLLTTNTVTGIDQGPFVYTASGTESPAVILLYSTANGCYDKVFSLTASCIALPVEFASFTATRNGSAVLLKWETAYEQDNTGFAIERNTGNNWEQVGFIPTLAPGGNSTDRLAYSYNDLNPYKGISQYRLRQVDIDGRSKNSGIRAVKGEGQSVSTIVYPNPGIDGKVNIVFDAANVTRDVSVIDMAGRMIRQWKNVTNNNMQVDNLPPGIYILKIVAVQSGEQTTEKIIIGR